MEKISLIPDNEFNIISKTVQELRRNYYTVANIKTDFVTLLFTIIDELLELYAEALNKNSDKETFIKIKNSLQENCYLLQVGLKINTITDMQQIAYKEKSKFLFMYDESIMYPLK